MFWSSGIKDMSETILFNSSSMGTGLKSVNKFWIKISYLAYCVILLLPNTYAHIKPASSPLSKHWTIFFLPDEQTHFLYLLILVLLEIMPQLSACLIFKFISRTFKFQHTHSNSMQLLSKLFCSTFQKHIFIFNKTEKS